jgi:transcriptional regulator with XRE-family HTH domain
VPASEALPGFPRRWNVDAAARGGSASLASLLNSWRTSEGLTQSAVASLLGVSSGAVGRWERGTVPSPQVLARLAALWSLDPAVLRAAAGPDPIRRASTTEGSDATPVVLARLDRGVSQAELARRLSIGQATLSRWESGERTPHRLDVLRIAQALGMPRHTAVSLFEDYRPRRRQFAGRLPGLALLLAARGVDEQAAAGALGVADAALHDWLRGARPVPVVVVDGLSSLVGQDLWPKLAELRRPLRVAPAPPVSALAARRQQLGITQRQLGRYLGASQTTISAWEAGARPGRAWHAPLARALRWDLESLCSALGVRERTRPDVEKCEPGDLPMVLRELRESSGLSRAQLGRCVGVDPRTVTKWESGSCRPSARSLRRLAALFGVPVHHLARVHAGADWSDDVDRRPTARPRPDSVGARIAALAARAG